MKNEAEEAADSRRTAAATTDGQREEKVDGAQGAMSTALERAEKAEEALHRQGGRLVRTVPVPPAAASQISNISRFDDEDAIHRDMKGARGRCSLTLLRRHKTSVS